MSLTKLFNIKSSKRRVRAETETFGGKSFSRYFSAAAFGRKHGRKVEIEILQVKTVTPARVRASILRMV